MLGSATADTSATVRLAHPVSVCHEGFGTKALHPLPAPLHAVSVHPRLVPGARWSVVPPTAVTNWEAAGNSTPNPLSPELTVIATPGWLKCVSELVWPLDSPPPLNQ